MKLAEKLMMERDLTLIRRTPMGIETTLLERKENKQVRFEEPQWGLKLLQRIEDAKTLGIRRTPMGIETTR